MKTMGLIWDKRHRMYVEETPMEAKERAKRVRYATEMLEAKLTQEESNRLRRGYCPKCNMLLPENGKCFCGYVRKTTYTTNNVKNGRVNPAILAMYK